MSEESRDEITSLLQAWADGDQDALQALMPLVYAQLHGVAHRALRREPPGQGLQTTELVNEAYLRLVHQNRIRWQNRAHFLGVSAQLMRRILVDEARRRHADKRGAGVLPVSLDAVSVADSQTPVDVLVLDDALRRLTALDPQLAQVVELRFFGGLTVDEIADVLGVSPRKVKRHWQTARTWLKRDLNIQPA